MPVSFAVGFISCLVAAISYGFMFVPIKRYDSKDGVYVQFMMGNGIMTVGVIVNYLQGSPTFYPLAMLGGVIWAFGNVTAVPIINRIGMGLGILIWGSISIILGWANGRFGWFDIEPSVPSSNRLNILGLTLIFMSAMILFNVRSDSGRRSMNDSSNDTQSLVHSGETEESSSSDSTSQNLTSTEQSGIYSLNLSSSSRIDRVWHLIEGNSDRISGLLMAVFAGCCYGLNFVPVLYIQNNYLGASQNGLDYVFAHFTGAHLTTTCIFFYYNTIHSLSGWQVRPYIVAESSLPAIISGAMWGVGTSAWFIANEGLGEPVTFPIISTIPGMIAALLGVFVYREIEGKRNIVILATAIGLVIFGATLTALSKVIEW